MGVQTHLATMTFFDKRGSCMSFNNIVLLNNAHVHTHTLLRLVSYHVMMWREVKRVLFSKQLVVFVVHILLDVISPIVIIVFKLCNKKDKTNS